MKTIKYLVYGYNMVELNPVGDGESTGFPKDIIIVNKKDELPIDLGDDSIVVLHKDHANNSLGMSYSSVEGTFTCQHCRKKISISRKAFEDLLSMMSRNVFGVYFNEGEKDTRITLAKFVKEIPFFDKEKSGPRPEPGVYVQEVEVEN
jgi:hypothetical protein